jgi:MarR family transcriptional regulator, lower aerobic nicotinate degradation pathway regulator
VAPTPKDVARAEDLGIVDGLVQLSFLIQAVLGAVASAYELSVIQVRLLGVLRDREPGMVELARILNLEKSSLTGLVDRAERRELVQRTTTPEDRRAVHVRLTAKGRRLATKVTREIAQEVESLAERVSDLDRKRLSLVASQLVLRDAAARHLDPSTSQPAAPSSGRRPHSASPSSPVS